MPGDDISYMALNHWPVHDRSRGLVDGCLVDCDRSKLADIAAREAIGRNSAGWWECELATETLSWTAGVYQMFGFPPGTRPRRDAVVALYTEPSRARLEALRSHAIAHRSGFALDAEIRPSGSGPPSWIRLIGAPVIEGDAVTHLQGLKLRL